METSAKRHAEEIITEYTSSWIESIHESAKLMSKSEDWKMSAQLSSVVLNKGYKLRATEGLYFID